jgi:hypothetical protein
LCWSGTPVADVHPDYIASLGIEGKPHPLLVAFVADKWPQFIHLHRQTAFWLWAHLHLLL